MKTEVVLSKDKMSSLEVAELTGKRHADVMRDIRNLLDQGVHERNFAFMFRINKLGNGAERKDPYYNLTKKGCLILASGYDAKLREKIIDRWEELEEAKQTGGFQIPQSYSEALMLAAKQAEQIEQANRTINRLQPKADFADAAFQAEGKVDIGQAAKILGLPFGRNTLFKKLKEKGIFFVNRNEPKQKYIDAKYFELTQLPPIHRHNHPDIITMKVICTQKGLAFINHLFGGNPPDGKLANIK